MRPYGVTLFYESVGFACDNQFFVGGDNQHLYLAVLTRNIADRTVVFHSVLFVVDGCAKVIQAFHNGFTNGNGVFADACGKYDAVCTV